MSTSSSTRLVSIPTRSGSRPTSLPGRSSRNLNADKRRREILRTCESRTRCGVCRARAFRRGARRRINSTPVGCRLRASHGPLPMRIRSGCRGPPSASFPGSLPRTFRTTCARPHPGRPTSSHFQPRRSGSRLDASWPSFSSPLWRWPPARSGSRPRRGLGVSPHRRLHRRCLRPSPCSVRSSRRSSFWSSRYGTTESRSNAVPSSSSPRSSKPPRGAITRLRMLPGGLRGRRSLHPSTRRLILRRVFALPSS